MPVKGHGGEYEELIMAIFRNYYSVAKVYICMWLFLIILNLSGVIFDYLGVRFGNDLHIAVSLILAQYIKNRRHSLPISKLN